MTSLGFVIKDRKRRVRSTSQKLGQKEMTMIMINMKTKNKVKITKSLRLLSQKIELTSVLTKYYIQVSCLLKEDWNLLLSPLSKEEVLIYHVSQ